MSNNFIEEGLDQKIIQEFDTEKKESKKFFSLRKLFYDYLTKLHVGFGDPCCLDAAGENITGLRFNNCTGETEFWDPIALEWKIIEDWVSSCLPIILLPQDFTPTIDINSLSFATTGSNRDFLVNISEVGQRMPSVGQIQFTIKKMTNFTITYSTTSGFSNIFGPTANNNSDWTFVEFPGYIRVTLKQGIEIPSNTYNRIGFHITRKAGVPANTSELLVATITAGGGDSVSNDNVANVIMTAN